MTFSIVQSKATHLPLQRNRRTHFQRSRREILFSGFVLLSSTQVQESKAVDAGDWTSPGLANKDDEGIPKFVKMENGVRIQELLAGNGRPARNGDRVEIDYVLRRSNGYFIYSTVEGVSFQPRDVPIGAIDIDIGAPNVIPGLSSALVGMKMGGRRRVLIPAELGYENDTDQQPQPPTFAAKRQIVTHAREPLLFEVELVKIRER